MTFLWLDDKCMLEFMSKLFMPLLLRHKTNIQSQKYLLLSQGFLPTWDGFLRQEECGLPIQCKSLPCTVHSWGCRASSLYLRAPLSQGTRAKSPNLCNLSNQCTGNVSRRLGYRPKLKAGLPHPWKIGESRSFLGNSPSSVHFLLVRGSRTQEVFRRMSNHRLFQAGFGFMGFPDSSVGNESRLQCGRPGFNPWVRKISWRRKRLPTPVFWPGEFHGIAKSQTQLSNFHFSLGFH